MVDGWCDVDDGFFFICGEWGDEMYLMVRLE